MDGGQAAQLSPLKAWLLLAATLALCPAESEDQARGPHALLLTGGWRDDRDASCCGGVLGQKTRAEG